MKRRLAATAGVEVDARAQRELLGRQRSVAGAEQRREALLRAQGRGVRGVGKVLASVQRPCATSSPSP
ncbi:MAG: hypothetical protein E6G41_05865 [Actinobacteria bacterium]|nr:MAG: hypothetical protein E6G41_05865 [Actinomycetota bacterium]